MGTPPRDDGPGTDDLRVITLASACTPMPLHVPFRHELEGFTVFRSRSGEGDSELYYLHVGYFATDLAALQAREVIRRYYPFATIERAPRTGMGSLEDTLDADFQVLAAARVVARRQAPPKPAAPKPAQRFAVLLDVYLGDPTAALPEYERYQQLAGSDDKQLGSWLAEVRRRAAKPEPKPESNPEPAQKPDAGTAPAAANVPAGAKP